MNEYGITIDTVMIQNVFETNPAEAAALFNGKLLAYVLLLGVLPAVLIWRWPVSYRPFFRGLLNKLLVIAACVLVIGASVGAFYSTYAPIFREEDKLTHFINPTNYIYAISKYTKQRLGIKSTLWCRPSVKTR
jgi:lipid A ethanolaminephosphotransferase